MINFHFSEIECSKIHNHKIFLSFESFQPIPNLKDKTSQTNFPNRVSCLRYIRRLRNDSDYVNLSAVPRSTINPPYEIRNKDRKTTPWWRSDSSSRKGKLSFSSIIRFYTCYFIFAFVNDKHRNGSGGCFFFSFFFWFENRFNLVCKRNRRTSEIPRYWRLSTGQLMFRVIWFWIIVWILMLIYFFFFL